MKERVFRFDCYEWLTSAIQVLMQYGSVTISQEKNHYFVTVELTTCDYERVCNKLDDLFDILY